MKKKQIDFYQKNQFNLAKIIIHKELKPFQQNSIIYNNKNIIQAAIIFTTDINKIKILSRKIFPLITLKRTTFTSII